MANRVKNEANFDEFLEHLAKGLTAEQRAKANEAGAKAFIDIMKPKVPKREDIKESAHLRDSLIEVENPNGSVEVGFTKKGGKGYIGRILNDGWTPKPPGGRKLKSHYAPVAGLHFWEQTIIEAKGQVSKAVYAEIKDVTKS